MRRRLFTSVLAVSCCAGAFLLACTDDDTTPVDTGGVDAATGDSSVNPGTDSGVKADGSITPVDAGSSSGSDAAGDATTTVDASDSGVDAGPTRTVETRSTGRIRLAGFFAQALFSEDDTIIRWSNSTECLAVVRSASKPFSTAGTVTIAGQIIGADGGPANDLELNPPDYYFDGVVLPPTSEFTVDISEGPSNPSFPALTTQTIRPSSSEPVTVTGPLPDAGSGELSVPGNKPLTLTWTPPAGNLAEHRFAFDMGMFPSGADGSKDVHIYCDAPLSAGTLTLPAELLADAVAQTVPVSGTPTGASLTVFAGGHKIVTVKNAVYIITASTDESTTLPPANVVIQ